MWTDRSSNLHYKNKKAFNKKLLAECLVKIGWWFSISQSWPGSLLKTPTPGFLRVVKFSWTLCPFRLNMIETYMWQVMWRPGPLLIKVEKKIACDKLSSLLPAFAASHFIWWLHQDILFPNNPWKSGVSLACFQIVAKNNVILRWDKLYSKSVVNLFYCCETIWPWYFLIYSEVPL